MFINAQALYSIPFVCPCTNTTLSLILIVLYCLISGRINSLFWFFTRVLVAFATLHFYLTFRISVSSGAFISLLRLTFS